VDRKVYDFSTEQVGSKLVSWLRTRHEPATVADLVAGTGLPKYQVEQTMKSVVDEYAGHLQVSESGELAYYFPAGMRSTVRGFGPAFRRGLRTFLRAAGKVAALLFKIWIVVMLVGYFVLFVALALLSVFAMLAASTAGGRGRDRRRGPDAGGLMFLVIRMLDFALRMWFWSSLFGGMGGQRQRRPRGRPLYQGVFGFVFGEPDPNRGYDEELRRHAIAVIRARRGVITPEELMAITGRDAQSAERLANRWLVEFEGEPGVTEEGTLIYSFPELLRSSAEEQRNFTREPGSPPQRVPVPFDGNPRKTDNWIMFFNIVNLLFGGYFLFVSYAPRAAVGLGSSFTWLYQVTASLVTAAGAHPAQLLAVALGVVPAAFSVLFFVVPAVRRSSLNRHNEEIKTEALARRIYARVLENPSRFDLRDIRPLGADSDPRTFEQVRQRLFDRFAAAHEAEPEALPDGGFVYRFKDLERGRTDLARYRESVDLGKFAVGKTVFDSGQ
jgi:hypothetical protein